MDSVPDLLLASKSPRRHELLRAAGIRFAACEPGAEYAAGVGEHDCEPGDPRQLASERARRKAVGATVGASVDVGVPVLAVDTVVDLRGSELGKAADAEAAAALLGRLRGQRHQVHTAHCLRCPKSGEVVEELVTATVGCDEFDAAQLAGYLESGQWHGKAGAYGIQDPSQSFFRLLDGAFDTVVGLHVAAVRRLLLRMGGAG